VRWLSTSLFEGEVWKQEIEHLGFKAQYSNIYIKCNTKVSSRAYLGALL
jgi:hypothetical protein